MLLPLIGEWALVAHSDVRPTEDQEVAGSIPAGSGNILSWSDMFLVLKFWIKEAVYSMSTSLLRQFFFSFNFVNGNLKVYFVAYEF